MPTVVLIGTLDTKGVETLFVRDRLRSAGCDVVLVDVGVVGPAPAEADVGRDAVAASAGTTVADLIGRGDRSHAMEVMGRGAAEIVGRLLGEGRLDAVMALGGSGGSSIATAAMRSLPVGIPKLVVSTIASGDIRAYVGQSDITMMYSVLDVSGLNSVSTRIFENAAAAAAGMAGVAAARVAGSSTREAVAVTMFGVTTPAATTARQWLERQGYEVLVFHANGAGGRSLEKLAGDGALAGVLDLTTTELADELVGGVLSAGPDRLEAAGRRGLPQVVSLGALDMVNFGPFDTVPERFRGRRLHPHNAQVTLMRTTVAECRELGHVLGRKLRGSRGATAVFLPRRGLSAMSEPGGTFHHAEADAALFEALLQALPSTVEVVTADCAINDPDFATAMARRLHHLIQRQRAPSDAQG